MMLRMSVDDWQKLQAFLALIGWQDDLKSLYQLKDITEFEGQKFCSVPDSLVTRLNNLLGDLSWWDPTQAYPYVAPLLGAVRSATCSQWIPSEHPVPAEVQARMDLPQAKGMELSTPVLRIPTEADFVRALGEEAYSLLHSESKPWVWPEK